MFRRIDTRSSKGFTLIEVVIAMSIGLIGMLGGYALLANIQGTMAGNVAATQAQDEARNVVAQIAREIRESSSDRVLLYSDSGSNYVLFYTPRDENREFIVKDNGRPDWQRYIYYGLDPNYPNQLRRIQVQESLIGGLFDGTVSISDIVDFDIISKNVERIFFKRVGDMITISVKTFVDRSGTVGHVARSYADFRTMVKMRN